MSLYMNLRKYLENENRDPKEPFLTNALVDFLNRLPPYDSKELILNVLLNASAMTRDMAASASLDRLRTLLRPSPKIVWKREDRIPCPGRDRPADITARISGRDEPFLIVEAKLGAKHIDQLNDFGKGLAALHKTASKPAAALIFLTHTTLPPKDFLDVGNEKNYGVPLRSVCSWILIHGFLSRNWLDEFNAGLARELRTFLGELGMDTFNRRDIKVMSELFRNDTHPKITPFFEQARKELDPVLGGWMFHCPRPNDPFESAEGHGVWDWCYHGKYPGRPRGWYIAWGLCVPREFYEDETLPQELTAFVDFSSELSEESPVPVDTLRRSKVNPTGWQLLTKPEPRYLKTEKAENLAKSPGGFTPAFLQWLKSAFQDADRLFIAAKSRL